MNRKADLSLRDHKDFQQLANTFSQFYQEKVATICSSFSKETSTATVYPSSVRVTTVLDSLHPVMLDEVQAIICKFATNSCDLDPMPTHLLKKCLPIIVPAIMNIINSSFKSGIVPRSLKIANVRPVLKKSGLDRNLLQNYQPVSNLPFLSIVLENHSVETLLVSLTDHILGQMDKGHLTAMILLDVSSAFDTVHHSTLIDRLNSFGVTSSAID